MYKLLHNLSMTKIKTLTSQSHIGAKYIAQQTLSDIPQKIPHSPLKSLVMS